MAQVARAATQAGGRRPAIAEAAVGAVPRDGPARGRDPRHGHGPRGARRPRRGRDASPSRTATRSSATPRPSYELRHRPDFRSGNPGARRSGREGPLLQLNSMLSERQQMLLRRVVEAHVEIGQPVGSKWLSERDDVRWSPSTIRYELAALEELGYLEPPAHLRRAGADGRRLPPVRGLGAARAAARRDQPAASSSSCRPCGARSTQAMRVTTSTLSQVTDLLAAVSAPPLHTATIKHIEVLLLQPQIALVVVITSTGAVTKRAFTFDEPVDAGLADWAASYLNERLAGTDLGALTLRSRLVSPELSDRRAGLPGSGRAGVLRPGRHRRGHAVRGRCRAPAGGQGVRRHLGDERRDPRARAPGDAARRCCARR